MYVSPEETHPVPYALGLVSTVVVMVGYIAFAIIVAIATTLASITFAGVAPDISMIQGATFACTVLIGLFAQPHLTEYWEETLHRWSFKNGL